MLTSTTLLIISQILLFKLRTIINKSIHFLFVFLESRKSKVFALLGLRNPFILDIDFVDLVESNLPDIIGDVRNLLRLAEVS
jgi:hypothetical protein